MAHPKRFWRELLIVAGVYFLYDRINNISTPEDRSVALNIGRDILRLEQFLHLDIERSMNEWLVGHRFLGSILANFYNLAHIWVMVVIVVFWLYPVAPPRMLAGFTDVIEQTGAVSSFHSGALAPAANQFAAMPSLHMAWGIWCVVAIYRTLSSRGWRLAGWAHVILTKMRTGSMHSVSSSTSQNTGWAPEGAPPVANATARRSVAPTASTTVASN